LEKKAITMAVKPSVVNLESGVTIDQAIETIFEQTGNQIQLHENMDPATGQKKLTDEIKEGSFWDALDALFAAGNLEVDPYGGSVGTMMLRPANRGMPTDDASSAEELIIPSTTAGMLHIEVRRISATRSPRNPALCFTTLELLTRWEPKVTPISIELEADKLEIVDDQGNEFKLKFLSSASR